MIVLDANILIRAILGRRVHQLIDTYSSQGVCFFAPDVAFDDAEKYLPPLLKKRGKPTMDVSASLDYLRNFIEPVALGAWSRRERLASAGDRARLGLRNLDRRCRLFWYWDRGLDYKSHRDFSKGGSTRP